MPEPAESATEPEELPGALLAAAESSTAVAVLAGERIDTRGIQPRLGEAPLVTTVREGGLAAVFRYGVVVFFGVPEAGQRRFLETLAPSVGGRADEPERDSLDIRIDPDRRDRIDRGVLHLAEVTVEHLQLVADVLAKSVVLAYYEESVGGVFETIEPLATALRAGRIGRRGRDLVSQIGDILLIQHRMVGRVEVLDKPELLWERADLERLYLRTEAEFEIRERHVVLERKLEVISDTSETLLEMLQTRQGLRVEWYIVLLIVVEIGLTLYQMLFRH